MSEGVSSENVISFFLFHLARFSNGLFRKNLRWVTHAFGRLVNDDATDKRKHLRNFFKYEIQDCIALLSLRTAIDYKKKKNSRHLLNHSDAKLKVRLVTRVFPRF